MIWLKLCVSTLLILSSCAEYPPIKILGVFHTLSEINFRNSVGLMEYLAKRGHQITIIAPFMRPKYLDTMIKFIEIDDVPENAKFPDQYDMAQGSLTQIHKKFTEISLLIAGKILKHKKTEAMLKDKTIKFDLVMHEVMCGDIMLAFSNHYRAHAVGLSMHGTNKWATDLVGSPVPMSYIPNVFLPYDESMSFIERIHNFIATLGEHYHKYFTYLSVTEEFYKSLTRFKRLQSISTLRTSVAMVFVNTHFTIDFPRPYVPNLIEVGGFHIKENLTGIHRSDYELEQFMADASHGVVYVSLGPTTNLPMTLINELLKTFSQHKQKFIFQYNGKQKIVDPPTNVLVKSWVPQQDILALQITKAFITHGGLLSIMETLHFKKPIIGIPIIGDQYLRVKSAAKFGYGIYLDMENVTQDSLTWALDEVLHKERYYKNAQKVGSRFDDKPYDPKENINNLLQYVIRTNGAKQMHNAGQELNFVEFHNLDVGLVYIIILVIFGFLVGFIYFVGKTVFGVIWPPRQHSPEHID